MCFHLACQSAWLRENDSRFFLASKTLLLGTRTLTRHRNCPSPCHLHSRNGSSCREVVETQTAFLPVARQLPVGCLGRLLGSGENTSDRPMRGVSATALRGSASESLPWHWAELGGCTKLSRDSGSWTWSVIICWREPFVDVASECAL